MKRLDIKDLPNGQRMISGVTDIFMDCPLIVKAGDRSWHAANYGQDCTFRVVIDGPGEVSIWRRNEQVLPEPEAEPEPAAEPAAEPEAEAEEPEEPGE